MTISTANGNNLETHSMLIKMLRIFAIPILNVVPSETLKGFIRKYSPFGKNVIERPGTTHSLEEMYTKKSISKNGLLTRISDYYWDTVISQPKAIRNRLRVVRQNLIDEIGKLIKENKNINILDIGGGSSRAIIETASNFDGFDNIVKVTNIDTDVKAIELGKEIAKDYNLDGVFTWINGNAKNLRSLVPNNSFEIVEMVGLLDYFNNERSIKLISDIYSKLRKNGLFIVGNVFPNSEVPFVSHVGWPKMYYKDINGMLEILTAAGFEKDSISLIFEPLKVHVVGLARK